MPISAYLSIKSVEEGGSRSSLPHLWLFTFREREIIIRCKEEEEGVLSIRVYENGSLSHLQGNLFRVEKTNKKTHTYKRPSMRTPFLCIAAPQRVDTEESGAVQNGEW